MGIMDNEGHDPLGFGNVRSDRAAKPDRPYRTMNWAIINLIIIAAVAAYMALLNAGIIGH